MLQYPKQFKGDRKEVIYELDADREVFLSVLAAVCKTYNWGCHAYCLMDNHYHLLIETPDGNLSKGMRQLNGMYTQKFNRIHSSLALYLHKCGFCYRSKNMLGVSFVKWLRLGVCICMSDEQMKLELNKFSLS